MHTALSYLGTLPDATIVYSGHEYTAGNVAFAKSIDPENPDITRLGEIVEKNKITTGLTTIGDEKAWNVFMRLGDAAVRFVWVFKIAAGFSDVFISIDAQLKRRRIRQIRW
jgi:hydroxyacylglutathione hydrolase